MKASELRIGSLVYDSNGKERRVGYVNNDGVIGLVLESCLKAHSLASIEYIKPIALTEEWLEGFGFEVGWIISHKDLYFNLFQVGENYYYTADMHHHTSEAIKYVHQLQNLCFALTGEELKLKE